MKAGERAEPRDGLLAAAIAAAVVAIYAPALAGGFVWDDNVLVTRHPAVQQLQSLGTYFGQLFWTNPEFDESPAFYRPITILSYAVQQRLFGPEPFFFHLFNVLVHATSCVLLFFVCRRAGASARAAALGALLFGTFPRLSESVAWISGRTDLLASCAVLAAWLLHDSEPGRTARRVAAALLLLLGLMAKEVAIAGALALSAHETWRAVRGRATPGRALTNLAPLAAALVVYAGARAIAWQAGSAADAGLPPAERPVAALHTLGRYAAMLADPLRPRLLIGVLGEVSPLLVAVGAITAAAGGGAAVALLRRARDPHAFAAAALVSGALLPVLHLVPISGDVVAADRYLYLPAAGLAVLGVLAARAIPERAQAGAATAALLLALAFASTTSRRAGVWADEMDFWQTAAREAGPAQAMGHAGLGEALLRRERFEEALASFVEAERRSLQRSGTASEYVTANMALCLSELGRHDDALLRLEHVAARHPKAPLHHVNLALVHARRLDFDASESALGVALTLYPDYPRASGLRQAVILSRSEWEALPPPQPDEATAVRAARARVHGRLGNRREAERHWSAVLAADDARDEDLHRAAVYLVLRGDPERARIALARLRQAPGWDARARELEAALAARRSAG
jgi:tetratricopeptide (TPR) repeat protein